MKKIFSGLSRIPFVALRYNPLFFFRLAGIYLLWPILAKIIPSFIYFYRVSTFLLARFKMNKDFRSFRSSCEEIISEGLKGYSIGLEELGLSPENIALVEEKTTTSGEVVLGDIDQTGLLYSYFGQINDLPVIDKDVFRPRYRFKLKVVLLNGRVGVKKDYNGNKFAFVNELRALSLLNKAKCNIPAIMAIDFDDFTITFSYVKGIFLHDAIARLEAETIYKDQDDNFNLIRLISGQRRSRDIQPGKCDLDGILNDDQVNLLYDELQKIHRARIVLKDIKYGNIVVEGKSSRPYIVDFDFTRYYPSTPKSIFAFLKDRDIERFNKLFSTEYLTFKTIKAKTKSVDSDFIKGWYAPAYFGAGARIGRLWDCNVGYGRWNYLLSKHLPSLSGKRVMDLGANNAFNSLQMLRAGASQAMAVELETDNIERGMFAKAAFEWSDSKHYDLQYIHANMKDVPSMDIGKCDVVIALCSLYYLNDEQIADVVRYVSTLTDLFFVQCNISPTVLRGDECIRTKSSVQYNLDVLGTNGFSSTKVVAPKGYTRPLIIAQKAC